MSPEEAPEEKDTAAQASNQINAISTKLKPVSASNGRMKYLLFGLIAWIGAITLVLAATVFANHRMSRGEKSDKPGVSELSDDEADDDSSSEVGENEMNN